MHSFMEKLVAKTLNNIAVNNKVHPTIKENSWTPDIVISRDPGSGGRPVAQKVAKKLGWKLFDRQIMTQLAKDLGIPPEEFAEVDEHTRKWFADTFHSIFNSNYVSDIKYVNHLKKLLMKATKDGDVVIVGRGANLILPREKTLSVRITASFNQRVENTYKYEGKKTREEAAEWVSKVEEKRANFIRQYFHVNPYNPWFYDLVISTDHYTLEQARDIIIEAYFTKFPSERRRLKNKVS